MRPSHFTHLTGVPRFASAFLLSCFLSLDCVHGAMVTVSNTNDSGPGSLRQAIADAPVGALIYFDSSLELQTVNLTSGQLNLDQDVTIDANTGITTRITIDAGGNSRIFYVQSGVSATLESLTLTGGDADHGGAINADELASVTMSDCTILDNSTTSGGGAIEVRQTDLDLTNCVFTGNSGGAISRLGPTTISLSQCTFSGNSGGIIDTVYGTVVLNDCVFSYNSGPVISSEFGDYTINNSLFTANDGGAIYNAAARFSISGCTFSDNSAPAGGAIYNDQYYDVGGIITLTESTLSGNTSSSYGGAIFNSGSSVHLTNCTLAGNSASHGGAIYNTYRFNDPHRDEGSVTLTSSTVTDNSASDEGGGIHTASYPTTLTNSIVAGNKAPDGPNLFGIFSASRSLVSGDPMLAPLGEYGGPTQTMPPLPGSPAIDAGETTALTTDQRGFTRVVDFDFNRFESVDIGAVELDPAVDFATIGPLDFDGDGNSFAVEYALGTDPMVADSDAPGNLLAPSLDEAGNATLRFGFNSDAASYTHWILYRSLSLTNPSWDPIYRYSGGAGETYLGNVTSAIHADHFEITDMDAPSDRAFYRFGAELNPSW